MTSLRLHTCLPLPLGAKKQSRGTYRFALFSSQATQVVLVLRDPHNYIHEVHLSKEDHRTGAIWHIEVEGISDQWSYAFRLNGPNHAGSQFDFTAFIADPYAKNIQSPQVFGGERVLGDFAFCYLQDEPFLWEGDVPLKLPREDLVVYEMHVRSFTWDHSSKTYFPGTFLGIIEKIDHLKKLGVNAIELLPIFEFDEAHHPFKNAQFPHLCNYWGYATVNFFSPCRRYAYGSDPTAPIREFKTLVKALHAAGIEVWLDVVFNHTGFDKSSCPLPWIDLSSYYMVNENGDLLNYSGCGNTVNTNVPATTQWIVDVLRYWVEEMHVDGFRFDLASVFSRGTNGAPLSVSPILQAISSDPILADTKLIAEPWDAGGLYQVGVFPTISTKWSEWNGPYRDQVKAFLNGDPQLLPTFASRVSGSEDIYPQGSPLNSINYLSCHDGFTLYDSVAYNNKHNEENGEDNRDGTNANYSYNFGEEGPTQNPHIIQIREKQLRNFFLAILLSQGIPMLQSGDEYGHSALGNNNRWALDSMKNYFLWNQLETQQSLFDFVCRVISLRKQYHEIFQNQFLSDHDVKWFNADGTPQQWYAGKFLSYEYPRPSYSLFICFYTDDTPITIQLPKLRDGFSHYKKIVDSTTGFSEEELPQSLKIEGRTTLVAISEKL